MTTMTPKQPTTLIGTRVTSEAWWAISHRGVKRVGEACDSDVGVDQTYGKYEKSGPLNEASVAFCFSVGECKAGSYGDQPGNQIDHRSECDTVNNLRRG